jgi:hypothetical protein
VAAVAAAAGPARKKARVDEALDAGTLYTQVQNLKADFLRDLAGLASTDQQTRAVAVSTTVIPASETSIPLPPRAPCARHSTHVHISCSVAGCPHIC